MRILAARQEQRRGLRVEDDDGVAAERRHMRERRVGVGLRNVLEHVHIDEEVDHLARRLGKLRSCGP
jgi:hypothetical protein